MNDAAPITGQARRWRWRVFSATWLSYACYYFARKPFYVVKSSLESELGWNSEMLGLAGASYLTAYALGQFLSGWLGDRWGPRLLVLTGMGVSAGANLVFGLTNSWGTFLAFMVLNGLAQSTGWCGNVASMAQWTRREERGTIMGLWATNFQVGGVAANGLAAFALGAWGFQWSFFAGSLVLGAAWFYFHFNQRDRPEDLGLQPLEPIEEEPNGEETGSRGLGWSRQVWVNVLLVGVFYFFIKFIRYALWSWSPYLLNRYFGLAEDDAGYLSTVFDLAGIFGVLSLGLLSDRLFGGRRVGLCFLFICGLAASCVALYLFGGASPLVFAICIGFIGFTLYGPDAIMTSAGAIEVGSPRSAALAAGIINGMGAVGSILQELVLGRMVSGDDMSPMFGVLLAASAAAAVLLGVLVLRNRRGLADL
ncbi:MAG: MFS transporter [Myxococcota bacterium]|nr:MFS transporter [Myxococcota bacterium]